MVSVGKDCPPPHPTCTIPSRADPLRTPSSRIWQLSLPCVFLGVGLVGWFLLLGVIYCFGGGEMLKKSLWIVDIIIIISYIIIIIISSLCYYHSHYHYYQYHYYHYIINYHYYHNISRFMGISFWTKRYYGPRCLFLTAWFLGYKTDGFGD